MTAVSVWRLFAFMADDEAGRFDERRRISEWQIQDVVRWCTARGYDSIYLSRDPVDKVGFEKRPPVPVRHHMHLVEGSKGEQPGDAAA